MDISIITFTLGGRDHYLSSNIISSYVEEDYIEHHLIYQGANPSEEILELVDQYGVKLHIWPQNIGIGAGLNKIIPQCTGKLLFKMDDDCRIVGNSYQFFKDAMKIHSKLPNCVFSPYPVGLINNAGGPKGICHFVLQDGNDIFTLRSVTHVGGFARFTPANLFGFKFQNDLIHGISGNEDGQLSQYCLRNSIPMFYLENRMIVEHNESTIGQIVRYPEYFKNRINESSMKIEVIV